MTPSQAYRSTQIATPPRIYQGADAWMHGWARHIRPENERRSRSLARAREIHELVERSGNREAEALRRDLREFRREVRARPEAVREVSDAAMAAIIAAARLRLGLLAHPVQIAAALALLRGDLVEMATGEGKTLAIALAAVVHSWTERPCHVVTANDYLAGRDAEYLAGFFDLCGIQGGHVVGKMSPEDRRSQYRAAVVYTTSKELAADFLRDDLSEEAFGHPGRRLIRQIYQSHPARDSRRVLRGLHTVLIDEADNALIDEAVTPLIISQSRENQALVEATLQAVGLCRSFVREIHFVRDERNRTVKLKEEGFHAIEIASESLSGIWKARTRRVELVLKALEAREFFHRDKQYVIEDHKVVIVDESTGRRMPGRSWRQGLHQAVEAKEGVPITSPAVTVASISFQRFFRQFHVIAGATGTAWEAAGEFWRIYGMRVHRIPPHRPCRREERSPQVFATLDEKWSAVVAECRQRHGTGQPILVGTRSVADSEALASRLREESLPCQVLNAVRHRDEAAIIAGAGRRGRITIATNMAGRGTDIRLEPGVGEAGGLCVIGTEFHDSARVDRQLFGRSGRQGDPGLAMMFASLEDELPRKYLAGWVTAALKKALNAHLPAARFISRSLIQRCQKRSEKEAFQRRERVLKNDEQRKKSLGFAAKS
jgi:preprotein translocase subunit SecA